MQRKFRKSHKQRADQKTTVAWPATNSRQMGAMLQSALLLISAGMQDAGSFFGRFIHISCRSKCCAASSALGMSQPFVGAASKLMWIVAAGCSPILLLTVPYVASVLAMQFLPERKPPPVDEVLMIDMACFREPSCVPRSFCADRGCEDLRGLWFWLWRVLWHRSHAHGHSVCTFCRFLRFVQQSCKSVIDGC